LNEQRGKLSEDLFKKSVKWINQIRYNQDYNEELHTQPNDHKENNMNELINNISIDSNLIGEVVLIKDGRSEVNSKNQSPVHKPKSQTTKQIQTILDDIKKNVLIGNKDSKYPHYDGLSYSKVNCIFNP
jgi:hypothetical protein